MVSLDEFLDVVFFSFKAISELGKVQFSMMTVLFSFTKIPKFFDFMSKIAWEMPMFHQAVESFFFDINSFSRPQSNFVCHLFQPMSKLFEEFFFSKFCCFFSFFFSKFCCFFSFFFSFFFSKFCCFFNIFFDVMTNVLDVMTKVLKMDMVKMKMLCFR